MSQRLFGTDGVRSKAGQPPLDAATIRRLGASLVKALPSRGCPARLVTGRDTRESGAWIEREFAFGVRSAGGEVTSAGVIPTPAVALLARELGLDAGVVISASHNPFEDNGIKVFSGAGEKFTEALEREVEAFVNDPAWAVPDGVAPDLEATDLSGRYLDHVQRALPDPARLGRLAVAIDCANGATCSVAPRLFAGLGLGTIVVAAEPDGRNINLGCGSTHPERLARTVVEHGADLGVAFDGDGDRAIFVDHAGRVLDGDAVLLMCARHLKAAGRLAGDAVVATVMSNIGLELALRASGIAVVRCPVGDKYVMEEMLRRGLSLGGEQSGHVIFSERLYTGDGLVTALSVLDVMASSGRRLAALSAGLVTYPQVLVNVRVGRRADVAAVPPLAAAIARAESRLAGIGRVLVRYSGTEPLLRIMLEGRDRVEIEALAEEIAAEARTHLN